ncbi:hypothetical protein [Kamptonema formosum]|uniref:hypothetical protein n=1 Tax=Kamptonema formosum TaxID=331992 RepID=UPI001E550A47|nr:hypothetical protein [Oscillatoria sp. PCC 10802]
MNKSVTAVFFLKGDFSSSFVADGNKKKGTPHRPLARPPLAPTPRLETPKQTSHRRRCRCAEKKTDVAQASRRCAEKKTDVAQASRLC